MIFGRIKRTRERGRAQAVATPPPPPQPVPVRQVVAHDSRHSARDPIATHDLYERLGDPTDEQRSADRLAQFEIAKIRSACRGFSLYSVAEELDRLEHGRHLRADPSSLALGTSWLYAAGREPRTR